MAAYPTVALVLLTTLDNPILKILSSTNKNFESIKRRSMASNVIGSICHNYKKEAATPDKRGKKSDVK
ncbi:hypothetical protein HDU80_000164 [Chytriomyces hyalinus]|nr:hypothetical protein HDU80_000164 [Chytriomyces hyalinus]